MIGFRVDANEIIATGHLMRCIAIAEQIRKKGEECIFFLADNKCTEILREKNFKYEILNTDWENLDNELEKLLAMIGKYPMKWFVVDSYQASKKYIESINKWVPVMAIDIPENERYQVSAVLNYSHVDDNKNILELYENSNTKVFADLSYAPLREEFFPENRIYKQQKQIMITTGGTDPYHISKRLVKELLQNTKFDSYRFCVVLGRMCEDAEELRNQNNARVEVLQGINNMAEIMQKSEIVFTAGGSTCIELCACQVPTICFSFADNQIPFSQKLNDLNVIHYIGDIREENEHFFETAICEIDKMSRKSDYRELLKRNMQNICDGLGARRIATYLCDKL